MVRMTRQERATALHAATATNAIATVAGHLAKLREVDPAHDATYRQMLTALGEMSGTIRSLTATKDVAA